MGCDMKRDGKCRAIKHYKENCVKLREIFCPERMKQAQYIAGKKQKIKRADEPLGIGA